VPAGSCARAPGVRDLIAQRPARRAHRPRRVFTMQWTKPEFTELRLGFEVTLYILNR